MYSELPNFRCSLRTVRKVLFAVINDYFPLYDVVQEIYSVTDTENISCPYKNNHEAN
jgi:hypothetical protein